MSLTNKWTVHHPPDQTPGTWTTSFLGRFNVQSCHQLTKSKLRSAKKRTAKPGTRIVKLQAVCGSTNHQLVVFVSRKTWEARGMTGSKYDSLAAVSRVQTSGRVSKHWKRASSSGSCCHADEYRQCIGAQQRVLLHPYSLFIWDINQRLPEFDAQCLSMKAFESAWVTQHRPGIVGLVKLKHPCKMIVEE